MKRNRPLVCTTREREERECAHQSNKHRKRCSKTTTENSNNKNNKRSLCSFLLPDFSNEQGNRRLKIHIFFLSSFPGVCVCVSYIAYRSEKKKRFFFA